MHGFYSFSIVFISLVQIPLYRPVKIAVFTIFTIWTCVSIFFIADIDVGLDQQLTMATDSYVYKYFAMMTELLSMGPPVYWVLGTKLQLSDVQNQNLIIGGTGCNSDSLNIKLYLASTYSDV